MADRERELKAEASAREEELKAQAAEREEEMRRDFAKRVKRATRGSASTRRRRSGLSWPIYAKGTSRRTSCCGQPRSRASAPRTKTPAR